MKIPSAAFPSFLVAIPCVHGWVGTVPWTIPLLNTPSSSTMTVVTTNAPTSPSSSTVATGSLHSILATSQYHHHPQQELSNQILDWYQHTIGIPPAMAATIAEPPTKDEIQVLRQAFAAFYGTNRDYALAEKLLSESIQAWQKQPSDEQAGLYRVRGDCYMALLRPLDAIADYSKSISLIRDTPEGKNADAAELPASLLGRARAIRSLHGQATLEQKQLAVQDYRQALILVAREEWDTEQELLEDGAKTNPYATWEYGTALRVVGDYSQAQTMHQLASDYFDDIGDRARSVISSLDAGIDAASATQPTTEQQQQQQQQAIPLLKDAIARTKTVEGRDIPLLQRVIAKEGEGRMALASVAWTSGDRVEAEKQLGLACQRLDQLEADAINRNKINPPVQVPPRLLYTIDDGVSALDISCTRLRNQDYLTDRLEWPKSLQEKVGKLFSLSK